MADQHSKYSMVMTPIEQMDTGIYLLNQNRKLSLNKSAKS